MMVLECDGAHTHRAGFLPRRNLRMTVAAAPGADDAREVAQEYEQERPARRLGGPIKYLVWGAAGLLSVFVLLAVFRPTPVLQYRMTFLAVALPLTFLVYRLRTRSPRDRPAILDWLLAAASVVVLVYPLLDFNAFATRGTDPTGTDIAMGIVLTLLLLEATRRT